MLWIVGTLIVLALIGYVYSLTLDEDELEEEFWTRPDWDEDR